jgi:hypothetical protein
MRKTAGVTLCHFSSLFKLQKGTFWVEKQLPLSALFRKKGKHSVRNEGDVISIFQFQMSFQKLVASFLWSE